MPKPIHPNSAAHIDHSSIAGTAPAGSLEQIRETARKIRESFFGGKDDIQLESGGGGSAQADPPKAYSSSKYLA